MAHVSAHFISFDPDRVAGVLADPLRLRALERLQLLDSGAEERFDRITRLAARVLNAPVCLISLVDSERQFFKSAVGLEQGTSTPLSHSFCQYSVASGAALVVPDARAHPVLASTGGVTDLGVGAYLGVPLQTLTGEVIGTLCALEMEPRTWTAADRSTLEDLAAAVIAEAELLASARDFQLVDERMARRGEAMERLMDELRNLRETERRRLAGQVHDNALQDLVAALMVIQLEGMDPVRVLPAVTTCIQCAIHSLRGVIDDLAPLQLPHADAEAFLHGEIREVASRFGLELECRMELPADLAPECKTLVHRAAMEFVRNACRHSGGATVSVDISLDKDGASITIAVGDTGPGWGLQPGPGAGMRLLTEDVHAAGGTISGAMSDRGFVVTARLPLEIAGFEAGDAGRVARGIAV